MVKKTLDALATQRLLRRRLDAVKIGERLSYGGLSVWPLLGGRATAGYRLLDEALAEGSAQVTEIGEDGSVPELRFANTGGKRVLLADGEELIGAKQNRSLNLSILAPAGKTITIPVSCMERGRWGYRRGGEAFRASPHVMSAEMRMKRERAVTASLERSGGEARRSNQGAVWAEIDAMAAALEAPSETAALHDAFVRYEGDLDAYVEALAPPEGACGAVFAIEGGPHGLDLFDAQSTFAALYPKLIRSWSLDAVAARRASDDADGEGGSEAKTVDPRMLLDRLARRRVRVFPAVGLGVDARTTRRTSRLQGTALATAGGAVHVSAFHRGLAA